MYMYVGWSLVCEGDELLENGPLSRSALPRSSELDQLYPCNQWVDRRSTIASLTRHLSYEHSYFTTIIILRVRVIILIVVFNLLLFLLIL